MITGIFRFTKNTIWFFCVLMFFVLPVTGCLDIVTRVMVNPDGSGKIVRSVYLDPTVAEMVSSASGRRPGGKDIRYLPDTATMKREAAALGAEWSSIREMDRNGQPGYELVYTFKTLSQIRLPYSPLDYIPEAVSAATGNFTERYECGWITFKSCPEKKGIFVVTLPGDSLLIQSLNANNMMQGYFQQVSTIPEVRNNYRKLMGLKVSTEISAGKLLVEKDGKWRDENSLRINQVDVGKLLQNWNAKYTGIQSVIHAASVPGKDTGGILGVSVPAHDTIMIHFIK
ncbi:MAG: hypothetical protein LWX56_08400 [Ignavibacteria bacterium]|nr:hypothetical protein [Ignavibacteria bacterium]